MPFLDYDSGEDYDQLMELLAPTATLGGGGGAPALAVLNATQLDTLLGFAAALATGTVGDPPNILIHRVMATANFSSDAIAYACRLSAAAKTDALELAKGDGTVVGKHMKLLGTAPHPDKIVYKALLNSAHSGHVNPEPIFAAYALAFQANAESKSLSDVITDLKAAITHLGNPPSENVKCLLKVITEIKAYTSPQYMFALATAAAFSTASGNERTLTVARLVNSTKDYAAAIAVAGTLAGAGDASTLPKIATLTTEL
jgi:hypothetical protein